MATEPQGTTATIPQRVGRYEVILPIASGGMATVYLARSNAANGFSREVALKLTHAHLRDTPEFKNDLLEEAKLASGVRHPNVVPVLEVDEDPLGMYLIMDYVEGETLGGLRRKGGAGKRPLPPAIGMRVLLDALSGLHAAHELRDENGELVSLVHRDFSPQNIIVGLDGSARLTDFGIAKAASRLGHTQAGLVKGKISYMAPEQARSLPLDRRCDVWAAGVIAWELLAQRRLHPSGDGDVGTLLKVVSEEPAHLRSIDASIPADLERVVATALTIDRDRRFPSALALSKELAAVCKKHGLLADHEDVSAYLGQTVGAKLAERRGRAAEVLRLRAKMGAPGSTKENDERLAKDIQDAIRPLAEMLEPEADADIDEAMAPFMLDTPGHGRSTPDSKSKVLSPAEAERKLRRDSSAALATDPSERTTGSASSVSFDEPTPPTPERGAQALAQLREIPARIYLGAVAVLAFGVALGAMLGRRAVPHESAVIPSDRGSISTVASVMTPASNEPVASPVSSPSQSILTPAASSNPPAVLDADEQTAHAASTTPLPVHANWPIASFDVEGRSVAVASPSRDPALELTPEERARSVRVTAHATDGRESTLLVLPTVDRIAIEFPARPKPIGLPRSAAPGKRAH